MPKKILIVITLSALVITTNAQAEPEIWQVLLAEAANQGFDGLYAVACVIRNRGGIDGFAGANRKDLDEFCAKQPKKIVQAAKRICVLVFENQAPDITNGATHYENIQRFGVPYWAKDMVVTVKIGAHAFYR